MPMLPPPHPASLDEAELLTHCRTRRSRTSGPGGQHRNKVETAVVVTHEPTGISARASERRQQAENHDVAVFRLRIALAIQVRTPRDLAAGATHAWRSRIGAAGAIACNPRHRLFPAMLAEALDVLSMKRFDLKAAALLLHVTPSQLIRLIAKEPAALAWVNQQRALRRLHPLR